MPNIVFVDGFQPLDKAHFNKFLRVRGYEYIGSITARKSKRPVGVVYQNEEDIFLLPYLSTYRDFHVVEHTVIPCKYPVKFLMTDCDDEGMTRTERLVHLHDKTLEVLKTPLEGRYAGSGV